MKDITLILRVASRFLQADQPPGMRKEVRDLVSPVNRPKGINRDVIKDHGKALDDGNDDTISPNRKDIRPKDVFIPKIDQVSVRNLAETGTGMEKVIRNKIPKDKGYDTVHNLSQYLIETGGGTKPLK